MCLWHLVSAQMNAAVLHRKQAPDLAVEKLISEYGLRPVLLSVVVLIFRRRKSARTNVEDLPDHIRQDIGLPPVPEQRNYWDYL